MELIKNDALPPVNFEEKLIIGISGKKCTGKSTTAQFLLERITALGLKGVIINFGDTLKDEISNYYGFDRALCDTQEGKETLVPIPSTITPEDPTYPEDVHFTTDIIGRTTGVQATVRHLLQWYGTDYRRDQDPDYWLTATKNTIESLAHNYDVIIVSDVRFVNEFFTLASYPYNYVCRLMPHPKYVFTEDSYHPSETELDNITAFDDIWYPKFGTFYLKLIANKINLKVLVPFNTLLEDLKRPTKTTVN